MYNFHTGTELLKLTQKHKAPISEIVIRHEMALSDRTREEVIARMEKRAKVMKEAIRGFLKHSEKSVSGMSGSTTPKLKKFLRSSKKTLLNKLALKAMTYAIATGENNAAMGRIVAFPTAGSSGVIPGVLLALQEELKLGEKELIAGMFTAAGIGIIIAENATLAGSEGGCQAEIGSSTAMAAAAATELLGGTPKQCFAAAALALKNLLGLSCDPVGGMVEVPCIKRSGLAAVYTLAAVDLALMGVESFIPFDQVVAAMSNIGKLLSPKLRETALGGLALSPEAKKIEKKLGIKIEENSFSA